MIDWKGTMHILPNNQTTKQPNNQTTNEDYRTHQKRKG